METKRGVLLYRHQSTLGGATRVCIQYLAEAFFFNVCFCTVQGVIEVVVKIKKNLSLFEGRFAANATNFFKKKKKKSEWCSGRGRY